MCPPLELATLSAMGATSPVEQLNLKLISVIDLRLSSSVVTRGHHIQKLPSWQTVVWGGALPPVIHTDQAQCQPPSRFPCEVTSSVSCASAAVTVATLCRDAVPLSPSVSSCRLISLQPD